MVFDINSRRKFPFMRVNLVLTSSLLALFVSALASLPADADTLANSPLDASTGSNAPLDGPSVWSSNEEMTALAGQIVPGAEFPAKGIPLGTMRLFPDLLLETSYDTNVYRTPSHEKRGAFVNASPTLNLDYVRENGDFRIYGDGSFTRYANYPSMASNVYVFGSRADYYLTRALNLSGDISYGQLVEPLSSPDVVGLQDGPTPYALFQARGQAVFQPNRIAVTVGGSVNFYTWFNTPTFEGGTIGNRDRDNSIYSAFIQGTYHFAPGYGIFLRASDNSDQYAQYFDRYGIHRASNGYGVDVGLALLLGNLIQGEGYAGYNRQIYDHQQIIPLRDITGPDFGANLVWFPTPLLTVRFGASHQIEDTIVFGAAGGNDRNVHASLGYEITRRINLMFESSYDDTSYPGSVPFEDDKITSGKVTANWFMSRYMSAHLSYEHSTRASTRHEISYTDSLVTVGLQLRI